MSHSESQPPVFRANRAAKQNATDLVEFPLAFDAMIKSFYVDDALTGADSIEQAIELRKQLQDLFSRGVFLLMVSSKIFS